MDITAIGEILIDLTQTGINEYGVPVFAANPGGAPANLAVAAARLGAKTAFIGKTGCDAYGSFLKKTLEDNDVDVSNVFCDSQRPTTLAVVSVDDTGERYFSFYRDNTADVALSADEVPAVALQNTKILHFGSVSLTNEPSRSATLDCVKAAKSAGSLISYDPNYRAALWMNKAEAVKWMLKPLPMVDILKISDEEFPLMVGTNNLDAGTELLAEAGIKLILVTLGADGVYYRFGPATGHIPGFKVAVGDTNGAGDSFFGAVLSRMCKIEGLNQLSVTALEDILSFANKAAAITTSRHGAIPAMPTSEEVASAI